MELLFIVIGIWFLIWIFSSDSPKPEKKDKERLTVVKCIYGKSESTAVLKRQNNTYALVQRNSVFEIDEVLLVDKAKVETFTWITEKEYIKKYRKDLINKNRTHRISIQENNTNYCIGLDDFLKVQRLNYWNIYRYNVRLLPSSLHYTSLFNSLDNGTKIIHNENVLRNYVACYGGHHYHKLQISFKVLFEQLKTNTPVSIIDYGCGQALATTVLYDYIEKNGLDLTIEEIVLIEPSLPALERGIYHLNKFIDRREEIVKIKKINKEINQIVASDISTNKSNIRIHLFSNILDVEGFDLENLASKIKTAEGSYYFSLDKKMGRNFFICLSPFNPTAKLRIDEFIDCFDKFYAKNIAAPSHSLEAEIYNVQKRIWGLHKITMYHRIFHIDFTYYKDDRDDLPF